MWLSDVARRPWPTMAVAALILYLTLMPSPEAPPSLPLFEGADKVVHAAMMATLTATALFDRRRAGLPPTVRAASSVALWVMSFGVFTELAQGALTTDRSADPADALADWCGTLAAAVTGFFLIRYYARNKKRF